MIQGWFVQRVFGQTPDDVGDPVVIGCMVQRGGERRLVVGAGQFTEEAIGMIAEKFETRLDLLEEDATALAGLVLTAFNTYIDAEGHDDFTLPAQP